MPAAEAAAAAPTQAAAEEAPKPKKICCACPETRKPRDECMVKHGEEGCAEFIEAHKACLRAEGFKVTPPSELAGPCQLLALPDRPFVRQHVLVSGLRPVDSPFGS